MSNISIVTITKNSEGKIGDVVRNALEIGSEAVVVDTGSTDNTIAVAENAGANVVHFSGEFDYSTPRNLGTNAASGDWVLHLDDDEWLDPRLRHRLHEMVATTEGDVFCIHQCDFIDGEFTGKYQPLGRLLRRGAAMHKGLVHEDIYPITDFGVPNLHVVHHTDSRVRGDEFNSSRKQLATREADRLLRQELDPRPDSVAEWFSRIRHLYGLLDAPLQARSRDVAEETYRLAQRLQILTPFVRITAAYFQSDRIGDHIKAIRILTEGLSSTPDAFQYHLALGKIYLKECKIQESRSALQRALEQNPNCFHVSLLLHGVHVLDRELQGDFKAVEGAYAKAQEGYPEFPRTE